MARILIADGDLIFAQRLSEALRAPGTHGVEVLDSTVVALGRMRAGDLFDLVLTDIEQPLMNGFEFLLRMRKQGVNTPLAFFSSVDDDDELRVDARRLGVTVVLRKALPIAGLVAQIEALLDTEARNMARLRATHDSARHAPPFSRRTTSRIDSDEV